MEQVSQDGNSDTLNSYVGSKLSEPINSMPAQSKDQRDMASQIEVPPDLGSNLTSRPNRPMYFVGPHRTTQIS